MWLHGLGMPSSLTDVVVSVVHGYGCRGCLRYKRAGEGFPYSLLENTGAFWPDIKTWSFGRYQW